MTVTEWRPATAPWPDVTLVAPYPTDGQRHAGPSGVASYTANLAHALTDEGAVVHVVAPREPSDPDEPEMTDDDGIVVHRTFDRGPTALLAACRTAAATRAPVVHLQHELFLYGGAESVPALFPALRRLRRRCRTVVTMHQVVDPDEVDGDYTRLHRVSVPAPVARTALRGLQRAIVKQVDACVVHERPFATILPGAVVIAHGVEELEHPSLGAARAQLELDDRFVVLCFGFVSPYKGLEACLEAGRMAGREVLVVVAGGEHPRLAASGDHYATRLAEQFAGPGVRFTGWVPEGDVGAWHAAADVALLAYPHPFASSGALALALAHGTPTLLSAGLAECVGAGQDAVTPIDAAGLAERLQTLATDTGALNDVRLATAPLCDERRWPVVADAHVRLYEDVLS